VLRIFNDADTNHRLEMQHPGNYLHSPIRGVLNPRPKVFRTPHQDYYPQQGGVQALQVQPYYCQSKSS